MKLNDLDKPLLREHIDFRIGTFKEGKGFSVLAYKDARVDMSILDEVVGKENWQVEYRRDPSGTLVSRIGIYCADKKEWVWKESNGTESNQEAEKGQYSDAFKRAGFMWGIGRALYDMPFIWVSLEPNESKFVKPNDWTWNVSHNGKCYDYIEAIDKHGKVRYSYGKKTKVNTDEDKLAAFEKACREADPNGQHLAVLLGETGFDGLSGVPAGKRKEFYAALKARASAKEV